MRRQRQIGCGTRIRNAVRYTGTGAGEAYCYLSSCATDLLDASDMLQTSIRVLINNERLEPDATLATVLHDEDRTAHRA